MIEQRPFLCPDGNLAAKAPIREAQNAVAIRTKLLTEQEHGRIDADVVEHEIATQPGVAIWVLYYDPKIDASVKVEGERVLEFPKMKEFQQVTIRANRIRSDENTGQLVIKSGELVP